MLLQVLLCFRAYFPKVCIVPCSYFSGAFNVKFHSHLVQNAEKKMQLRGGGRVSNALRVAKEQLAVAAVLPQSCHIFA